MWENHCTMLRKESSIYKALCLSVCVRHTFVCPPVDKQIACSPGDMFVPLGTNISFTQNRGGGIVSNRGGGDKHFWHTRGTNIFDTQGGQTFLTLEGCGRLFLHTRGDIFKRCVLRRSAVQLKLDLPLPSLRQEGLKLNLASSALLHNFSLTPR